MQREGVEEAPDVSDEVWVRVGPSQASREEPGQEGNSVPTISVWSLEEGGAWLSEVVSNSVPTSPENGRPG